MKTFNRNLGRSAALCFALLVAAGAGNVALADGAGSHRPGEGALPLGGPRLERILDDVDASPEQRQQIEQIAREARSDLLAQRETAQSLRQRALELFAQPTVDANAVETLRRQMLAGHDAASKRMALAMLDISRVLSPEQRRQIVQTLQQRRADRRPRRRDGADAS